MGGCPKGGPLVSVHALASYESFSPLNLGRLRVLFLFIVGKKSRAEPVNDKWSDRGVAIVRRGFDLLNFASSYSLLGFTMMPTITRIPNIAFGTMNIGR